MTSIATVDQIYVFKYTIISFVNLTYFLLFMKKLLMYSSEVVKEAKGG